MRARRYDQAIVLPNSFKSALIPLLAGIPLRTGYVGELRQSLLNDARRLDERALPLMAERYAQLAEPPGAPLVRPLPPLELRVVQSSRDATLNNLGLDLDTTSGLSVPRRRIRPGQALAGKLFRRFAAKLAERGLPDLDDWLRERPRHRRGDRATERAALPQSVRRTDLDEAVDLLSVPRWWSPTIPG